MPRTKNLDLTQGVLWKQLLLFLLPIAAGTLFQQFYSTVDAIVVGRFLGSDALAAVGGSAAVIVQLVVGIFTGLSSGATVVISHGYGADDQEKLTRAVHTSIAFSLLGGVCGLRILWVFLVVPHWKTLLGISICYPLSWVLTALLLILRYRRAKWHEKANRTVLQKEA